MCCVSPTFYIMKDNTGDFLEREKSLEAVGDWWGVWKHL